ncbi:MAG: DUF1295 domain-containing protein [Bacteroidota bacterium]
MTYLLYILALSVIFNLLMYAIAYFLQTDKITDISYSATFAAIAIAAYTYSEQQFMDQLILMMVVLWAIRLGGYLLYRVMKIGHDDRFNEIRNNPLSFLFFWIMQGLTCAIVSFAFVQVLQATNKEVDSLFILGIVLAALGWLIETIADAQKFKFKQANPKEFMNQGLWRKLRHPNYTGELMFWWGLFIASLPYVDNVFIALLSPIWISLIIIKFSGIRILQNKWQETYGDRPDYQAYVAQSWRLIPYVY